jgi:hypothetical protein
MAEYEEEEYVGQRDGESFTSNEICINDVDPDVMTIFEGVLRISKCFRESCSARRMRTSRLKRTFRCFLVP